MSNQLSSADILARIERLLIDARHIRRVIEHQRTEADKRVLNRQLAEIGDLVEQLREEVAAR